MEKLIALCTNTYLIVPLVAWFIAQLLKVIIVLIKYKKIDFRRFVGSGGMPSSHSALVTSMAVTLGENMGYDSSVFALSVVVALIIMYDAAGVRRAAGKQAKILNKIMEEMDEDKLQFDERLKELLGHSPIEVFAGAILGIIIALMKFN